MKSLNGVAAVAAWGALALSRTSLAGGQIPPYECPTAGANPVATTAFDGTLGIACAAGGITTPNTYAVVFTQNHIGDHYYFDCLHFGLDNSGSYLEGDISIWIDENGGAPSINELTLVASYPVGLYAGADQQVTVSGNPQCIELTGDQTLVVTLDIPQATDGFTTFAGGQSGFTTYIRTEACGIADFVVLDSIGFPNTRWWVELSGTDGCDDDFDGDGIANYIDNCISVANLDQLDTDGDGAGDACDGCSTDPDKTEPGACGCGVADTDTDLDGTPDCNDGCPQDPDRAAPGHCGCNPPSHDSDGDGVIDCEDGCPDDPDRTAPGDCGCNPPDSDQDGTPDCEDGCPYDPMKVSPGLCGCGLSDSDSDNDGTPDCTDECPDDPTRTTPGTCGCSPPDTDGDGVVDCDDACPGDPYYFSPAACGCGSISADWNGDGLSDCDGIAFELDTLTLAGGQHVDIDLDGYTGTITGFALIMTFQGTGGSWASDLVAAFATASAGVQAGGFDTGFGYPDLGPWSFTSAASSAEGVYSDAMPATLHTTPDASFSIRIMNGWSDSPGATYHGIRIVIFGLSPALTCDTLQATAGATTFSATGSPAVALEVLSGSGCEWTAATSVPWISVSSSTGIGNASLTFSVDSNDSESSRSGLITVDSDQASGLSISIQQDGDACAADSDGDSIGDCDDGCPNDPNKTSPGACGCGLSDADSDADGTPDCDDGCPSDPQKTTPGTCGCGIPDTNVQVWYPDADGDGFGSNTSGGLAACTQPTGWVLDNTDCNDGDPQVNPGAIEVCDNAIDEDCSGSLTDCHPALVGFVGETSTMALNSIRYGIVDIYAVFDPALVEAVNIYDAVVSNANGSSFVQDDLAGGSWLPTFTDPNVATADSYVTIGGDTGPASSNTTTLDPAFGSANVDAPPAGAGWYNSDPGNLQGLADAVTGRVHLGRFAVQQTLSGEALSFVGSVSFKASPDGLPQQAVASTTVAFPGLECPWDIDGDGEVSGSDIGLLLLQWGLQSETADFDGDGVVGGDDIGVLLLNWGPCL